jgi:membrane-associated phospholipid phosphatase
MKEKNIILISRVVSMMFTPFYLPLVGLAALFFFSYLNTFPLYYILMVMGIVWLFTVLLPTRLIHLYRRYHGWTPIQLGVRERRMVPYVISILCYFTCFYIMSLSRTPHTITSILIAALAVQMLCAMTNVWWKVSTHSAAIGGVAGGLLSFSLIFNFNPVWWLCLVILLGGMVGTSRMILRQHTLPQVVVGFFMGLLCSAVTILLV